MQTKIHLLALIGAVGSFWCFSAQPVALSLRSSLDTIELTWQTTAEANPSALRTVFELQSSSDLVKWIPVGERLLVPDPQSQSVRVELPRDEPHTFYRLLAVEPSPITKLGVGGAEIFGYADTFSSELRSIGQISPAQFSSLFTHQAEYIPGISWDPTTAAFWDAFNADPETINQDKDFSQPGFRLRDYRLDPQELAIFKTNGFVVSERLGSPSFGHAFYDLWHADLPVFVSCDSILQAWHRTYDAIMEETEETYLFAALTRMLDGMAEQLRGAATLVGDGVLHDSVLDADYFLAVARSLIAATNTSPVPTILGQDPLVAETLSDIRAEQLKSVSDFMGFCRMVDFSQFRVRGHYTHTERLRRYFQCLMWLGRIDLPVAGGPWQRCPDQPPRMTSPRELGTVVVLWHLLKRSSQFQTWTDIERTISLFVGPTDSLTFGALEGLFAGSGVRTLADLPDLASLDRLQASVASGQVGLQNIRSDWFEQPLGGAVRYALPHTFTVVGQKFVPDSWAMSQTVFSSILWTKDGTTNKVQRRVPGALDVAFSVLANDQVVPQLEAQMRGEFPNQDRPHAQKFRDGLPYQHNLAAVRAVMDQVTPAAWESNLYMNWLATLRELSTPTTSPLFPEAMRTHSWAMKTVNTQLASWTHLRHDTTLYAKQSYTDFGLCVYPTGFVEPRLKFWQRITQMADGAAEAIARLKLDGNYLLVSSQLDGDAALSVTNVVPLSDIQSRQIDHLRSFAKSTARLQGLVIKELARECFDGLDEQFIDGLMEEPRQHLDCGGTNGFKGWYPNLFYRTIYWTNVREFHANYGAGAFDALVTDVHTDVPCGACGDDPGSVLHEAVGPANLLMLAVDNGTERFVCAGPVLSHYEFEVLGGPRRIVDEEWRGRGVAAGESAFFPGILGGAPPDDIPPSHIEGRSPPPWIQSYLVPRPNEPE